MSDVQFEPFLTKSDCEKIISRKLQTEDFTVLEFQQLPFGKVSGFLGDHSTLIISIIVNGIEDNHRFFVKSLPKVKSQRDFVLDINGFVKEHFFFTKYINLLKKHTINILEDIIPTCLHTDGENFVFEDLTLQGFATPQSRAPLEIVYVKAALQSLAKLHASAIILEEKCNFKLNEKFEEEFAESFFADKDSVRAAHKSYRSGFQALIDLAHDSHKISKQLLKEKVFQGLARQEVFVKPSQKFRNTICHGDLWKNNVMYRFKKGDILDCVIVDFQSYRYGPPAQDVMAFLHLTTDRQFRKNHLKEMLQFYYRELDGNFKKFGLGEIITGNEFFTSCQYYQQFALTQACTHFQVVAMPEETAVDLLADANNAYYVLFENKHEFVVKVCEEDDIYRRMNYEAFSELREFYEEQENESSNFFSNK